MKPAPFKYFAPSTVDEVLALLAEHGFDAKILAGGQSLIPTMNFRLAQPAVLIDINRIENLFFVREEAGELRVGAMTRHRTLERSSTVSRLAPLLTETMPNIAHPQIRNRGTIGGSIAHADPAAELPATMLALRARFKLASASEARWVEASDFFIDLFMTELQPEELLTEIAVPALPKRTGFAFKEIARRHGDYALVGVAVLLAVDEENICTDANLVFMSVGNGPVVGEQAQQALLGKKASAENMDLAAAAAASEDIDPPSDMHASSDFRRHLTKVLLKEALQTAFERAQKA